MNFISLNELLGRASALEINIGETALDEEAKYSKFIEKRSSFAAELHAKLHNASNSPQWFEVDAETLMPLRSDSAREQGMAMLKHIAGRARRDYEAGNKHNLACIARGLDPNEVRRGYDMAEIRKFPILRDLEIGFDRSELEIFLKPSQTKVLRIAWHRAIFNAWPAMRAHYDREPTTREAIVWIKAHDTDGNILNKGSDTELWWKTDRGKPKEVAYATVDNVISKWRTSGFLPV